MLWTNTHTHTPTHTLNKHNKIKRNVIITFMYLTTPCNYWIVELLGIQRCSAYTHSQGKIQGWKHTDPLVLVWSANLQCSSIHILNSAFLVLALRLQCRRNSLSAGPQDAYLVAPLPTHCSLLQVKSGWTLLLEFSDWHHSVSTFCIVAQLCTSNRHKESEVPLKLVLLSFRTYSLRSYRSPAL